MAKIFKVYVCNEIMRAKEYLVFQAEEGLTV
jgi:hypothetical protein